MYLLGRSIYNGLDFLLLTVFDFALLNHITMSEEICGKVSGNIRCYLKVWELQGNWDSAWQLCNSRNSTLPVIRNRNDQDFFEKFLFEQLSDSAVWTSGRQYVYKDYTWVDGRKFSFARESDDDDMWSVRRYLMHRHMFLRLLYQSPYVCQYSGDLCSSFNDTINITNGCIREGDDRRSWYEARNQCLMTGGDLATLVDADLDDRTVQYELLYRRFRRHWFGLRSTSWRWNLNRNASEEDEIKYTNWPDSWDNIFLRDCISINASNGTWNTANCSEKLNVVCQRDLANPSSKWNSAFQLSSGSVEQDSVSYPTSFQLASNSVEQNSVSFPTFISVVIASICVIVISNIVVAIVVRRRCSNVASNSATAENMRYQDLATTQRQAIPEATYTDIQLQPVYEEVCQRGK